jgi:hypothetical protein
LIDVRFKRNAHEIRSWRELDLQGRSHASRGLAVTWVEIMASGQFWAYRLGAYLLLNVIDDPAWLALMFC